MRFLLLTLLCLSAWTLRGQEQISLQKRLTDTLRASYIETFPDKFSIYPVIKRSIVGFNLKKEGESRQLSYLPNDAFNFGIGGYLFELNLELTFSLPLDQQSVRKYGESDSRGFMLNAMSKRWSFEIFHQNFSGFYIDDSKVSIPPASPYPQRNDISTRMYGLTGSYLLNHERLSYRAVYNFSERQIRSAGSMIIFWGLTSFKMTADSSILTQPQRDHYGDDVDFTTLRYTTLTLGPGYTHTFVYKDFFINGTISFGPAHNWINYRLRSGEDRNEIAINTSVMARIGIGYNSERLFGGVMFLTQSNNVRFDEVRFAGNNQTFKILVGYRFGEFGILKKRAWDFVPFGM